MAMLVLILGVSALTAQATTYEDAKLHRMVRSPHYGGHFHYDQPQYDRPPPPPPFIYHTHNWSGVGRSIDGAVKGVFSGAAAAAESAIPASNSAFSLAASEAGATGSGGLGAESAECDDNSRSSGFKTTGQYNSGSKQSGFRQLGSGSASHVSQSDSNSGGAFSGGSSGSYGQLKESTSFSSQSDQNSGLNGFNQESNRGYGTKPSGFSSGNGRHSGGYGGYRNSFKESHYSVQNGGENQFGSQGSLRGTGQGSFTGSGQSISGGLNRPQAQGSFSDSNGSFGTYSQSSAQSGSNAGSGYANYDSNTHGFDSSKFQAGESETYKSQQLKSTEGLEQSAEHEASLASGQTSGNSAAGLGQHQSTIHGALELASQGLQAAENAKCSTCQKSSYALSNAKSHNGAAIALSIGG